MTRDAKANYTVGRGKPPVQTRFKPGQSGNPRGRPRGTADVGHALTAAANEMVTIIENGRRVRLSKLTIAARQLANKAASGDHRAIELLCRYLGSSAVAGPIVLPAADKPPSSFGSEDDAQVLEAFLQQSKQEGSP